MFSFRFRRHVFLSAVALGSGVSAVVPTFAGASSPVTVNVVGYSVVGPAFKVLEAAFQATSAGQSVSFTNSFGASDTQTSNVINGQPADIVNMSYGTNISQLVKASKVPSNWTTQELNIANIKTALVGSHQQTVYRTPGIVTDSVVTFIVRPGNPLHIKTWSDLVRTGVKIVTPNPLTSGSAKWNLLAAYSSRIAQGASVTTAQDFLKKIVENTISQPVSGSAAMAAFVAGTGNVLLDYEDSAKAALAAGKPISFVTPPQSFLIENPIAVTNSGVTNSGAKAFYHYLFSAAGQGILASLGYRPVLQSVWTQTKHEFPSFQSVKDLTTVTQLSPAGWATIDPEFFGSKIAFTKMDKSHPTAGIVTYLEQFAGATA